MLRSGLVPGSVCWRVIEWQVSYMLVFDDNLSLGLLNYDSLYFYANYKKQMSYLVWSGLPFLCSRSKCMTYVDIDFEIYRIMVLRVAPPGIQAYKWVHQSCFKINYFRSFCSVPKIFQWSIFTQKTCLLVLWHQVTFGFGFFLCYHGNQLLAKTYVGLVCQCQS